MPEPYYTNPDYLNHYSEQIKRVAIDQALATLQRYGFTPPTQPQSTNTQATQSTQNNNDIITIPVQSMEQAINAPIDAFRTFIFPNFKTNEIYIKRTDESGKELIQVFVPKGSERFEQLLENSSSNLLNHIKDLHDKITSIENKFNKTNKKDVKEPIEEPKNE